MKKISAFLLLAFLIMSISVGVAAQGTFITSVDKINDESGNKLIKVVGSCADEKSVTIEVLKKGDGITWENLEEAVATSDFAAMDYLYYFNQTQGENGEFSFSIKRVKEDGTEIWNENEMPKIRVFSNGAFDEYDYSKIIAINETTTVEEFKSALTTDNDYLKNIVEGLIKDNKLDIIENGENEFWIKLFNYKQDLCGIESFGEIVAVAPEIALLVRVGLSEDTKMPEVLAGLEEYGIMDTDSWSIYKNKNEFSGEDYLTDTQEAELYALLKRKSIPNPLQRDAGAECYRVEEFVKYFNEAVVLTACQGSNSNYLVRNIIEKSDLIASEDTGNFSKLGAVDKLAVAGIINDAQTKCTTISELAKKIADSAKTYTDDPDGDGSVNPGRTPSTGGGGGKTYSVEITPEKEEETPSKIEFSDIYLHKWAEEEIYSLQEKGIVQGIGENRFEPARAVTREEFVKMLVLSVGIFDESASAHFQDMAEGAWYVPYVGSAYKTRLINGITEELFGVGKVITREQLAVMVYRALASRNALKSVNTVEPFKDIDTVSDFAVDAVNYVKAAGLMNGMGDGNFAPHENVNRAQAAKVIYGVLKAL